MSRGPKRKTPSVSDVVNLGWVVGIVVIAGCQERLLGGDSLPGRDRGRVACLGDEAGDTIPTPSGFPGACDPSAANTTRDRTCCSDDPSAYDPGIAPPKVLPAYSISPGGSGQPIFSEYRNASSSWGVCTLVNLLPVGVGIQTPEGVVCPIPCDPTWTVGQVEAVCGANSMCCQTQETDVSDCVFDRVLECYRPVSGLDIAEPTVVKLDGTPVTWAEGDHATMQDGDGVRCQDFGAGDTQAQVGCFRSLRTAAQRGFCLTHSATVVRCPFADPAYIDACEALNAEQGLSCG